MERRLETEGRGAGWSAGASAGWRLERGWNEPRALEQKGAQEDGRREVERR